MKQQKEQIMKDMKIEKEDKSFTESEKLGWGIFFVLCILFPPLFFVFAVFFGHAILGIVYDIIKVTLFDNNKET